MSALIFHIHRRHLQLRAEGDPRGFDPACLLCVEERERAERRRPDWLRHLTARELETRGTVA